MGQALSFLGPWESTIEELYYDTTLHVYIDGIHNTDPTISQGHMGAGCIFTRSPALHSDNVILFEFGFDLTIWPSAFTAKFFAFYIAISILPPNTKCTIYTDCAKLVSTYHDIKQQNSPTSSIKRDLYPLWAALVDFIKHRKITLSIVKVPKHCDNRMSKRADYYAKMALDNPLFTLSSKDILAFRTILPCFNNPSNQILINPRTFIKQCQQALLFDSFISLKRFSSYMTSHSNQDINWEATWYTLKFSPFASKSHTNFKQSSSFVFASKLLMNELPTLSHLQKTRPDLYDTEWTCPNCSDPVPETFDHIWNCSAFKNQTLALATTARNQLINLVLETRPNLSLTHRQILSSLDCWLLPNVSSSSSLTFADLVKGIIPHSLVEGLRTIGLGLPSTLTLIATIVSSTQIVFRKNLWKQRINNMLAFECSKSITSAKKNSPFRSSKDQTIDIQSTSVVKSSPPTHWLTWICRSMSTGIPWTAFAYILTAPSDDVVR